MIVYAASVSLSLSQSQWVRDDDSCSLQAVILAAGGYAANRKLLQQHCPEAAQLATTNGPWAQGDVLDIAAQAGAVLRDLDQVQIHPTGEMCRPAA